MEGIPFKPLIAIWIPVVRMNSLIRGLNNNSMTQGLIVRRKLPGKVRKICFCFGVNALCKPPDTSKEHAELDSLPFSLPDAEEVWHCIMSRTTTSSLLRTIRVRMTSGVFQQLARRSPAERRPVSRDLCDRKQRFPPSCAESSQKCHAAKKVHESMQTEGPF